MSNECTLTDQELISKIDSINGALCKSGGKSWYLSVPPDVNNDPDLLIAELVKRFERLVSRQGVRVFVSWSNIHDHSEPQISPNKPIELDGMNGKAYSHYGVKSTEKVVCTCPDLIARILGINQGECKAFEIRGCEV